MIFYFSGTGNTKWAAARLAAATHEDLIPIAPYMRFKPQYSRAVYSERE